MKKKLKPTVKHISETIYGAAMKAPAPPSNYPLGRITLDDGTKLAIVSFKQEYPYRPGGHTTLTISAVSIEDVRLPL
jgi:hypothetical protein